MAEQIEELDNFMVFPNMWDAIKDLKPKLKGEVAAALLQYGVTNSLPENLSSPALGMLKLLSDLVRASKKSRAKQKQNGDMGGRPPAKAPQTPQPEEPTPQSGESQPKNPTETQPEPKPNLKEREKEKVFIKKDLGNYKKPREYKPPPQFSLSVQDFKAKFPNIVVDCYFNDKIHDAIAFVSELERSAWLRGELGETHRLSWMLRPKKYADVIAGRHADWLSCAAAGRGGGAGPPKKTAEEMQAEIEALRKTSKGAVC